MTIEIIPLLKDVVDPVVNNNNTNNNWENNMYLYCKNHFNFALYCVEMFATV